MALRYFTRLKHTLRGYLFNNIHMNNQSIRLAHINVMNDQVNNKVKNIIEYWHCRFRNENIAEPLESIQHILVHVLNVTKCLELIELHDATLSQVQMKNLESLCLCRLSRMPVQYLIGEWTFRDIIIKLVPPIFIPRPETEILIDFVVKQILNKANVENFPVNILEIGCGSGAISLAILNSCKNQSKLHCIAVDTDPYACKLTKNNARKLGFEDDSITILNATIEEDGKIILASDQPYFNFFKPQFDVIVSNPPYIPTCNIARLPSEIKIYEDIKSLDGGIDGLNIIKSIMKYASIGLKPSGYLFLEIDPSQPKLIQSFIDKYAHGELKYENEYKDYCNRDRFVKIRRISPFLR